MTKLSFVICLRNTVLCLLSNAELGRTSLVQHMIYTGDATPIKQMPYRTSRKGKQEIDRRVDNVLDRGISQESVSAWS